MAASDWNDLIHPSFSKNISLSCSVYDGLGIVLAMTRVQKSVHVADNHLLLRIVCWRFLMWWAQWDPEMLQTVPVGLRYKLVAVLKSEGGSPTSIYVNAVSQSPCHQEDSPTVLISSAICRFTSFSTWCLWFLWGGCWHLRTRRSESHTGLCKIFEVYREIAAFVISK